MAHATRAAPDAHRSPNESIDALRDLSAVDIDLAARLLGNVRPPRRDRHESGAAAWVAGSRFWPA